MKGMPHYRQYPMGDVENINVEPGEFVVRRESVNAAGLDNMERINHFDDAHGQMNQLIVMADLQNKLVQDNAPVKSDINGYPIADSPVRQRVDATRNMQEGGEVEDEFVPKELAPGVSTTAGGGISFAGGDVGHKAMDAWKKDPAMFGGEHDFRPKSAIGKLQSYLFDKRMGKLTESDPQLKSWWEKPSGDEETVRVQSQVDDVQAALGEKTTEDYARSFGKQTHLTEGSPYYGTSLVDLQEEDSIKGRAREAQYFETDKGRYRLSAERQGGLFDPVRNFFGAIPKRVDSGEDFSYQEGGEVEEGSGLMDYIHSGLDVAGMIPGVGIVPDAVNAALYGGEALLAGDTPSRKEALSLMALSGAAAVPLAGQFATAGKFGSKARKMVAKSSKKSKGMSPEEWQAFKKANPDWDHVQITGGDPGKRQVLGKRFKEPNMQEGGMVRGYQDGGQVPSGNWGPKGDYNKALQQSREEDMGSNSLKSLSLLEQLRLMNIGTGVEPERLEQLNPERQIKERESIFNRPDSNEYNMPTFQGDSGASRTPVVRAPSDSYGGNEIKKNLDVIIPYLQSYGRMKTPMQEKIEFLYNRLGVNPEQPPPSLQGLKGSALLQRLGNEGI